MGKTTSWDDLRPRLISAAVMIVVGVAAIWAGGLWFNGLIVLVVAVLLWELLSMTGPPRAGYSAGAIGAAVMIALQFVPPIFVLPVTGGGVIAIAGLANRYRAATAGYAAAILITGLVLITMRGAEGGAVYVLWLVGLVIATDVAGYFAGRTLGGPKFWPRVSPKKTWSGVIAGWIAAAALGALWHALADTPGVAPGLWTVVLVTALLSLASQLGDIAESALKRKVGVKDASNIIPGHGGVMDRFDGLIGAALILGLLLAMPLPW